MSYSFSYVSFEPIKWLQEIRDYQQTRGEGRYLMATCRAAANCHLLLNGKINVRDFAAIPLSILNGQPTAEDLAGLSQKALGGVYYIEDQGFLGAWFYLKDPAAYTALWNQVQNG